jgi:hypothetical protein
MSYIRHKVASTKDIQNLPIIGNQPTSEKEEKYLREICEFEFSNLEEPGLSNSFPYGDTKRQHKFVFFHGGKYKVPRFIARHVESCTTPIWKWRPDGSGSMAKKEVGTKARFQMRQSFDMK